MKVRIIALATAVAVWVPSSSFGQLPPVRNDQRRAPVVVKVSEGGFRWGDAAIGAAAASGAALALVGASLFRRQSRKEEE